MDEQRLVSLEGQFAAMNQFVMAIAQSMTAVEAQSSAVHLAITLEDQRKYDAEDETPETVVKTRDRIMQAYIDMLKQIARSR